jgi:hypothetical protein
MCTWGRMRLSSRSLGVVRKNWRYMTREKCEKVELRTDPPHEWQSFCDCHFRRFYSWWVAWSVISIYCIFIEKTHENQKCRIFPWLVIWFRTAILCFSVWCESCAFAIVAARGSKLWRKSAGNKVKSQKMSRICLHVMSHVMSHVTTIREE